MEEDNKTGPDELKFPDDTVLVKQSGAMEGLLFPWNRAYSNNGFRLCGNLNEILEGILNYEG